MKLKSMKHLADLTFYKAMNKEFKGNFNKNRGWSSHEHFTVTAYNHLQVTI